MGRTVDSAASAVASDSGRTRKTGMHIAACGDGVEINTPTTRNWRPSSVALFLQMPGDPSNNIRKLQHGMLLLVSDRCLHIPGIIL